jgi:hypothetical protein
MDDVGEGSAARLRDEFDRAIGESRSLVEDLLDRCDAAETQADETTRSLVASWRRRVHLMRNRSIARAATDLT